MKNQQMLICIFLITVISVSAQKTEGTNNSRVKFGIKLGVNLANITETPTPTNVSTSSLLGFTGGLFSTIRLDSNFAIQPEFSYSQMGATVSGNTYTGDKQKLLLTYLNVPILVKYYPIKPLALVLGPQIGFLNSASNNSSNGISSGNDISSTLKKNDFSGILGAEVNLSDILFLSARYQIGLANVSNSTDGTTDKNSGFTFTIDLLLFN